VLPDPESADFHIDRFEVENADISALLRIKNQTWQLCNQLFKFKDGKKFKFEVQIARGASCGNLLVSVPAGQTRSDFIWEFCYRITM
jgi:hypothetical protein